MVLTGAQVIVECLKEQGVDTVFGYPGGAILNVYDALYQYKDEITHVLTSHEQGASHAADGYARATGRVGVCLATSGPGATNLVTGIATAYMDSVPMVAITCNVGKALLGKDSFQEVDIAGIVMPVTKHSFIVKETKDLADTIRRAFYIAKSGRPGPVLVDVTKDVTGAKMEYKPHHPAVISPACRIEKSDIENAVKMIEAASKPFIFVGGGAVISGAAEEVRALSARMDAPVCDSLMGKGVFPGEDRLYTGMLGMHGTKASDLGVSECDLLVVCGSRFSDRVTGSVSTFAQGAKILQIDIDAAEINKNVVVDASIVGDVKEVVKRILKELPQQSHTEWVDHILSLKEKYPLRYDKTQLTGPFVIEKLYELTKDQDTIISTDVGQHQMWTAQYYKFKNPRTLLTSGGLGTMGYGLGAAIGAKTGCPDKIVVNIAGDGCFRMNMNEIATAVRCGRPMLQIVLNNHVLGMVRQWQTLFYEKRYSHTILNDAVDFVKLAEAMGAKAIRVTRMEEVEPALKEALAADGPVVLDCWIDQDLSVFPMVPAGASIATVFDEEDLKK